MLRRYSERGEDCAVGVLRIRFADGTVWSTGRLAGGTPIPVEQSYPDYGTGRADRLRGSDRYGDALYGLGGADRLYGYAGADVLDGGAGNDRLYGYADDDFLYGDAGDDDLFGDDGDDTYVFSRGEGNDVIDDSAGRMRLLLLDHRTDEVSFRRVDDSLVIDLADGGRITVRDVYAGGATIYFVRMRDGFVDGDPLKPPAP